MDLTEEQASALFNDDRGRDIGDVELSHQMTITRRGEGYNIQIADKEFELSQNEVAEMCDEHNIESIWYVISQPEIVTDYCFDR